MKKYIISFLSLILFISCNRGETNVLSERVKKLELENQKLKDSIDGLIEEDLLSMQLIGLPTKYIFKKNEESEIDFIFHKIGEIFDYQVVSAVDETKREIIIPNARETKFTYKFIPESLGEQEIRIYAEFQKDGQRIVLPGYAIIKVEE